MTPERWQQVREVLHGASRSVSCLSSRFSCLPVETVVPRLSMLQEAEAHPRCQSPVRQSRRD